MALIGNEMEYAKKILTGAVKEKNLFKALVILTKYYCFELGMDNKEIEKNLRLYIKAMGGNVDDEAIENIIKNVIYRGLVKRIEFLDEAPLLDGGKEKK